MKLTTTTWVTVDRVIQGFGGQDEDRRGGFARGGWAMPYFDTEAETSLNQVYQRADAFLLGRRTLENLCRLLGHRLLGGRIRASNPISVALNTQPKYVVSTTLTDPGWSNTTVLAGDVAAAIADLRAKPAGELQVHGSGGLIRWLLANDLVDEITLFVCPRGHRPGHAAVPRRRPGRSARPGGIAVHAERGNAPGLPAYRPPAVRTGHARAGTHDIGAARDGRPVPAV